EGRVVAGGGGGDVRLADVPRDAVVAIVDVTGICGGDVELDPVRAAAVGVGVGGKDRLAYRGGALPGVQHRESAEQRAGFQVFESRVEECRAKPASDQGTGRILATQPGQKS